MTNYDLSTVLNMVENYSLNEWEHGSHSKSKQGWYHQNTEFGSVSVGKDESINPPTYFLRLYDKKIKPLDEYLSLTGDNGARIANLMKKIAIHVESEELKIRAANRDTLEECLGLK